MTNTNGSHLACTLFVDEYYYGILFMHGNAMDVEREEDNSNWISILEAVIQMQLKFCAKMYFEWKFKYSINA